MKEIRTPELIDTSVREPACPFTSTGDVSAMYFGQNTLNAPHARPNKNLPIARQKKSGMSVREQPMITIMLVRMIHLCFPI